MSEWYLGDSWDSGTQNIFEDKLKRSRGSNNKAQYLRIKGTSLLKSKDSAKHQVGCELLKRVTTEYPNELGSVKYAYELLGDYYRLTKNYLLAEENYRTSILYYATSGRSGTSGIADVKLAELIIESDQDDKIKEMYELLKFGFFKTDGAFSDYEDKYRYSTAMAQICFKLNRIDEAKEYADIALQLAAETNPPFENHPQVGMVRAKQSDVEVLKVIAKA